MWADVQSILKERNITVHLYSDRYYVCSDPNCRNDQGGRFVTAIPANSPPSVLLNLKCRRCNKSIFL